MDITLNGLSNPSNIITFSDCPTILTVQSQGTGIYANAFITIGNLNSVLLGTEYYIEVNGERILSTNDISKAVGRRFYLTNQSNITNQLIVANKIVSALRNMPFLEASYNVYQTVSNGTMNAIVKIMAKNTGSKFNITINNNLPSGVLSINNTQGTNTDTLAMGNSNKICVDVYALQGTDQSRINSTVVRQGDYVTTLEKEYFKDSVSFDLSPLLTTLVDYGYTTEYNMVIYSIIDTNFTTLGSINKNYISAGYLVNQGGTFIPKFTGNILAQNVKRGEIKSIYNNTILYIYEPKIVFSLYSDNSVTNMNVAVMYKDSAFNTLVSDVVPIYPNNNLQTFEIDLNIVNFNKSYYIDINIPNVGIVRYKIIKPINAVIDNQRIYYTNSYGGTSFFDFTGDRTEKRKTTIETYQKQLFDYYTENKSELTKIYGKTVDITVTLKTHNMEKDGTWQFYDLQNSTNAWTVVNGRTYSINITDVNIEETTVTGIYTATVTYTYSLADSF